VTAQPVQVDRAVLAAAVATALARVPGVARLSPGSGVEVATQFAGGKVVGVGLRDDAVVAYLVVDRLPVDRVARAARAAAEAALAGLGVARRLDLVIDDVELDQLPPTNATGGTAAGVGVPAVPPTRRL
jgi:hypothetical protein